MITVSQMLREKGKQVWSVSPSTTLGEALTLMAEKGIGAVLVMEGEKIEGIFSERDFARQAVSKSGCSLDTPVRDMMTSEVFYIGPDQTTEECMALMTEKHFRHLPVMVNGKLAGLISIGDIVKWTISDKDIHIRSLENYIMGGGRV